MGHLRENSDRLIEELSARQADLSVLVATGPHEDPLQTRTPREVAVYVRLASRCLRVASGTAVQVYREAMSDNRALADPSWVPLACTLPTVEQPSRLAEFDAVFATAVRTVERVDESRIRLDLRPDPAVAARVADLLVRETDCCSFFTFTLTATDGTLLLEVAVPPAHVEVLDAIADGVAAGRGA